MAISELARQIMCRQKTARKRITLESMESTLRAAPSASQPGWAWEKRERRLPRPGRSAITTTTTMTTTAMSPT